MQAPVLATSRSVLMHATLAHLSPEVQALDTIIHGSLVGRSSTLPSMPTELLLLIRSHLQPMLIAHLLEMSMAALMQHELSLQGLLCSDCIAYNQEIYGPDVWQWQQFSGPCSCVGATGYITAPRGTTRKDHIVQPNPKKFTDPQHWLEHHLSCESLRLPGRSMPLSGPTFAIWDAVADVLRDYDCEITRAGFGPALDGRFVPGNYQQRLDRWNHDHRRILVAPRSSALRRYERGSFESGRTESDEWWARVILDRVDRDLGLSYEWEESIKISTAPSLYSTSRPAICPIGETTTQKPDSSILYIQPNSYPLVIHIIYTCIATIVTCLSLPFAVATITVTILCYYSKPRSFRVV